MKKLVDEHFGVQNWYGEVVCIHCGGKVKNQGLAKVRHLLSKKCEKAQLLAERDELRRRLEHLENVQNYAIEGE